MLNEYDAQNRATGLFKFLRGMAELKNPPVRTVETYDRDGEVQWFGKLADHAAIRSAHRGDEVPEGVWLEVDKLDVIPPPVPPVAFRDRTRLPAIADLTVEPELLVDREAPVDWDDERLVESPRPDPQRPFFEQWVQDEWKPWQQAELEHRPVREAYRLLFRINERSAHDSDGTEVLLAIGCLAWQPLLHDEVRRHLVVIPAEVEFHERTGRLSVHPAEDADPRLELDMLDPQSRPRQASIDNLLAELPSLIEHALKEELVQPVLRRAANVLDAEGEYSDSSVAPVIGQTPIVGFAPALILRRRSKADLVRIYDTIIEDLGDIDTLPDGIRQLVDIDVAEQVVAESATAFHLPLPANDEQLEIVRRVDDRPFTIVQGPPGTGKTHTIANLLSHLLAQGKRVLVTAETDRALRELRGKLPENLRTLCVSVIGTDRSDRNSLKVAIDTLATEAARFDAGATQRNIDDLRRRLNDLESEEHTLTERLIDIRGEETRGHEIGSYSGTLARIAADRERARADHDWIERFDIDFVQSEPPMSSDELLELQAIASDQQLKADEAVARQTLPSLDRLQSPRDFDQAVGAELAAVQGVDGLRALEGHPAYAGLSTLPPEKRGHIAEAMVEIARDARELSGRQEGWIVDALDDAYTGRPHQWQARSQKLAEYGAGVHAALQELPLHVRVVNDGSTPRGQLRRQAQTLGAHLESGGKMKGFVGTPKPVKEASSLLAEVRVDDLQPDTADACKLVDAWFDVADRLDAMDRLWPQDLNIPQEDTPHERLSWHQAELDVLHTVLDLASRVTNIHRSLGEGGVPQPEWRDMAAVTAYADVVGFAAADERLHSTTTPFTELAEDLRDGAMVEGASSIFSRLAEAVEARDGFTYGGLHGRVEHLQAQGARLRRRDALEDRLRVGAPEMANLLLRIPSSIDTGVLGKWEAAWQWGHTAWWITSVVSMDAEQIQSRLGSIERETERFNGELTAELAWQAAIGRLGHREQSSLRAYANAAGKIPKTRTAKTRPQRLRDAQAALRKCRGAVPSWVMPLYRIAESMEIERNAFDVVIIDEASQADTGASFLQYLAPQVVVVGDDKQVSPTVVGVQENNVQQLRSTHLADIPHAAVWADANASYFEICDVYFSDRVTLREHFRCMPEIIGFSNQIAYEPDGVPLIPLKQFGAGRLPPVQMLHVPDGWDHRAANEPEAIAVAELVQKLIADPAYDGKTFGVISLVGTRQHKLIDKELMARIEPEEYRARELRCGSAPDFQGSERDVIILSMVAAPDDSGRGPTARTTSAAQQRYNVAASRAKEQLWVVHSVRIADLRNPEDLRYKLLSYCQDVIGAETIEDGLSAVVPTDRLVEPFEEVFEQLVSNALIAEGYRVQPKYRLYGHRLDLVVLGQGTKLAVACDGDTWAGRSAFAEELRLQRQLERCGWPILRLRESLFTIDEKAALAPLLGELEARGFNEDRAPAQLANGASGPEGLLTEPEQSELTGHRPPKAADAQAVVAPSPPSKVVQEVSPPPPPQTQKSATDAAPPKATDWSSMPPPATAEASATRPLLVPYVEWTPVGSVPEALDATGDQLVETFVAIVEVEGPIVAERMFQLYVRASGGSRVGGAIQRVLNKACAHAERSGLLMSEDPLRSAKRSDRTLFIPGEVLGAPRQLGNRNGLKHVPSIEIRALMDALGEHGLHGEELHRRVLAEYGLKRYTALVSETLAQIEHLER